RATAAQGFEYIKALVKGKDDTLLSRTNQMTQAVTVEIQMAQVRTQIAILKNPLGAIAERMENQAFTAHRNRIGEFVEQIITRRLASRCQRLAQPAIKPTGTIDAHQHAIARLAGSVTHMEEGIDAGLGVGCGLIGNTVNHTGCAGGCSNFTRLGHIQAKSIIRLVASAIAHPNTRAQPQLGSSGGANTTLITKAGHQLWDQLLADTPVVKQPGGHL